MLALATLPGPAVGGIPDAADRASRHMTGDTHRSPPALTERGGPLAEPGRTGRAPGRASRR
ncbi:hypothetical protein [Streptomyces sundarbansensis]